MATPREVTPNAYQTSTSSANTGFAARLVHRLDLSRAATPRLLRKRRVHRWFDFPHSYSPELVEAILDEWNLPVGSSLLDPFVGAGTTLRVAQERGYSAQGTDISPLAVLASNVKIRSYDEKQVETELTFLRQRWEWKRSIPKCQRIRAQPWVVSERLSKAFTPSELWVLSELRREILKLHEGIRDLFMLALLAILPEFSRARANGGWFRWVERPNQADRIVPRLWAQLEVMLEDLVSCKAQQETRAQGRWEAESLDARHLDTLKPVLFDGLITSPPYANRHDYSRVFQIELLTLGSDETDIFSLRHASLRSHVEARAPAVELQDSLVEYDPSAPLRECLDQFPAKGDKRVFKMMRGYFEDLYLVLSSARKVLRRDAKVALVVGNVRHAGVLFPVDEIVAAVGVGAGYTHVESWVIRVRGNSAQQMGKFGRVPSRETVVILQAR